MSEMMNYQHQVDSDDDDLDLDRDPLNDSGTSLFFSSPAHNTPMMGALSVSPLGHSTAQDFSGGGCGGGDANSDSPVTSLSKGIRRQINIVNGR